MAPSLPYDTLSVLCLTSKRHDGVVDESFRGWSACLVHDLRPARRKAQLGVYDLYAAVARGPLVHGAILFWKYVRLPDSNTPFVFVLDEPLPDYYARSLHPLLDDVALLSNGATAARRTIERLLQHCADRALAAHMAIRDTVRRDLEQRLTMRAGPLRGSHAFFARAQEHVLRNQALGYFTEAGGSKAWFDRLWPELFEDALRWCSARSSVAAAIPHG
ncbi:MAG: hypothetical protein ACM3SS_01825 [Rhodospirillaceae bacterium]